jgi:voltage-gated potassium channel Kch
MPRIRTSIISAIFSLVLLISFGTWAYERIEGWTFGQSFYFSVATLTTVGYGDIHPSTDASRIFTAIYILVGVGIVIAALTSIGSKYLSSQERELSNNIARRVRRKEEKSNDKH